MTNCVFFCKKSELVFFEKLFLVFFHQNVSTITEYCADIILFLFVADGRCKRSTTVGSDEQNEIHERSEPRRIVMRSRSRSNTDTSQVLQVISSHFSRRNISIKATLLSFLWKMVKVAVS